MVLGVFHAAGDVPTGPLRGSHLMRTELQCRRQWNFGLELASATFEYVVVFRNRQRRHSSIRMLTPIEYDKIHTKTA